MAKSKREYGNESISHAGGGRPGAEAAGVIFGSDGLEGCEHAVFEILSNAIDEAQEGSARRSSHPGSGRPDSGGGLWPGLPCGLERKVGRKYNWGAGVL